VLQKYSETCNPQSRFFKLDATGTELQWGKYELFINRHELVADIQSMSYGPGSERFGRYDFENGKPYLCFSLYLHDRTVDLECEDESQLTMWYMGLQTLAPMSRYNITRGRLLWERAKMKVCDNSFFL
jgi:hypothetical protein